jgi:hypothetical protein
MRLHTTLISAFLFALSTVVHAANLTSTAAKKLAQEALQTMNAVETYAVIASPERIDSATYMRKFNAPLGRIQAKWPVPWYAPENKAIEPYQICIEAVIALEHLQFLRSNTMLTTEVEKTRHEYFFDKKPRCEQSIKTGKYTERADGR